MADLDLIAVPVSGEAESTTGLMPEIRPGTARRRARNVMALALARAAPGLNYGDEPWKAHPVPGTPFNAQKTALVHIYFDHMFQMHVIRVHFDAVTTGANQWADNEARVVDWINYLNSLSPGGIPDPAHAPTPFHAWPGFTDFAFNQQHHVAIYVQNKRVSYDEDFPVWFSDSLQNNVFGVRVATANHSFYEAEVYDVAGVDPNYSASVIHMKNYYTKYENGAYSPIVNWRDRFAYAININAAAYMMIGGWPLPIIIDPDTGNMGEGQP